MANCPNCNIHIKKLNWKPICNNCGINIPYFDMENRLLVDAEKAEAEHKVFARKMARIKAAYAGSKLTIARIILTVLPLGLMFLPLAKGSITLPFLEKDATYSFLTIFKLLQTLGTDVIGAVRSIDLIGTIAVQISATMLLSLAAFAFGLLAAIMLFSAHSKRGIIRQIVFASISFVSFGATSILFNLFTSFGDAYDMNFVDGSLAYGYWLVLAAFALCIVINAILLKTGVNIVYPKESKEDIPAEESEKKAEEQDGEAVEEKKEAHSPA